MHTTDIASVITEMSDSVIYVSTLDDNELLYLNKAGRTLMGVSEEGYLGKKCYSVLQGRENPCPSCTNKHLVKEGSCRYETYNDSLGRYYACHDKLIEIDGETYRLEIASDSTEEVEQRSTLQARLNVEKTLVRCARTLASDTQGGKGIDELLCVLGEFYHADRSYLFEATADKIVSNTYEWCDAGISPELENLQDIPLTTFGNWLESFDTFGMVHIVDAENTLDHDSEEYRTLSPQGIDSLLAVPVHNGVGAMTAFLGIDNPRRNTEEFMLLRSVTYFIQNELEKRDMLAKLNELSRMDSLTGAGNRNSYHEMLAELDEHPPATFGAVFVDLNDLKLANDTLGHSHGDRMIRHISHLICELFPEHLFRIGGDEFIALLLNGSQEEFESRVQTLREHISLDAIASASIGAAWSDAGESASTIVNRADKLMYVDKQTYREQSRGIRASQ